MAGATSNPRTIPRLIADPPPTPALRRVPAPLLREFLKLAEERAVPPAVLGASAAQIRAEIRRRGVEP